MNVNNRSIMLVDGMALLFRAYYATAYNGYIMKTSSGLPTNGVHGFIRYLMDAVNQFTPSHVVCCWDMGSKTFRTEKYTGYKSNRPDAPEELIPQFSLVKEVTESFGIPNVGLAGYEADDCIGTLADKFSKELDVYVLTGDHDMLQLVSDRTRVIIMKKGQSNYRVYDPQTLLEDKQLTAKQIIDLKGLTGDTSDNYPGVKGIGEKTAVKLLLEYQTIEGILENLEQLPKGVQTKIKNDIDMLHLSRDLAAIRCDVPIACELDTCHWQPDINLVSAKFNELEFKNLIKLIS
jgi:5'-3' exonuclease